MIIEASVVAILVAAEQDRRPVRRQVYTQPSWLPVGNFPGGFASAPIVTFSVAILFRTGREHHAPITLSCGNFIAL